jgi:hypothetical protein
MPWEWFTADARAVSAAVKRVWRLVESFIWAGCIEWTFSFVSIMHYLIMIYWLKHLELQSLRSSLGTISIVRRLLDIYGERDQISGY